MPSLCNSVFGTSCALWLSIFLKICFSTTKLVEVNKIHGTLYSTLHFLLIKTCSVSALSSYKLAQCSKAQKRVVLVRHNKQYYNDRNISNRTNISYMLVITRHKYTTAHSKAAYFASDWGILILCCYGKFS